MTVFYWPAIILACLYGGISAWGGVMQFRQRAIPAWSAAGMVLSGVCLVAAVTLPGMGLLVIPALLLLHLLAVVNGMHMYSRIHLKHHIFRVILSLILAVFLVAH